MNTRLLSPLVTRFLLVIMLCLPVWGSQVSAQTPKSYVVLDKVTGTLTFRHDTKRPTGAYPLNNPEKLPGWFVKSDDTEVVNKKHIEKVVFDASFADARPTSCRCWFAGCTDLKTIEGIEYLNTENVVNMNSMFNNCKSLTALDVSNFDTRNVTNMSSMFDRCKNLTALNVSNFDTKNVTDMGSMFDYCWEISELNVSNFDTKNVTNMNSMFKGCTNLTTLDVSNFDTKNVTDMGWMFAYCNRISEFNLSNFDTKNVTDMNSMFRGCNLTELNVSNFDTKNVTDMCCMFSYCKSLTALDVSNFDTQNVTDMSFMFDCCTNLTELNVSNFDTKNVRHMRFMFNDCINLDELNLANFDTKNVRDMHLMFAGCTNLTTIYVSDKFVTTACENSFGYDMFKGCEILVGAVPYDESKTGKEMANYITGYFTDIKTTGINATPISDNIAAKYYDVLGRRMNAPQKGINIVKRGGRTMKVLMK